MKPERLMQIVSELEESCGDEPGHAASFCYGGGADEEAMAGDAVGYRRLAARMLLASMEEEGGTVSLDRTLGFNYLELTKYEPPAERPSDSPPGKRGTNMFCGAAMAIFVASVIFAIIGFVVTVVWLVSVLF